MSFSQQTLQDVVGGDIGNMKPTIFETLVPKKDFSFILNYEFPALIASIKDTETYPTIPGKYFLKLVYFGAGRNGAWEGYISSNQIEICISK